MGCKYECKKRAEALAKETGVDPDSISGDTVLRLILKTMPGSEMQEEAGISTDPRVLHILADDPLVAPTVANNASTSPETLAILAKRYAKDRDMILSVAAHPNTSVETQKSLESNFRAVWPLAKRYSEEGRSLAPFEEQAKKSESIAKLFCESNTLDADIAFRLASGADGAKFVVCRNLKSAQLDELYTRYGVQVAQNILQNHPREKLSDSLLTSIWQDANRGRNFPASDNAIGSLCRTEKLPKEVVDGIVASSPRSPETVQTLAYHNALDDDNKNLLLNSSGDAYRAAMWASPVIADKKSVLANLDTGDDAIKLGLVKNRNTPVEDRNRMIQEMGYSEKVLGEAYGNDELDPSTMLLIAEHAPNWKYSLVQQKNCPDQVIDEVALEAMRRVSGETDGGRAEVGEFEGMALEKTENVDVLNRAMDHTSYWVNLSAALNPHLTPSQIDTCQHNDHYWIRASVLEKKSLTLDQARIALSDTHPRVRRAVIENTSVPLSMIDDHIVNEQDSGIQFAIAKRLGIA